MTTLIILIKYFSLDDVADLLLDNLVNNDALPFDLRGLVRDTIMKKKNHLFESSKEGLFRSFTDLSLSASKSTNSNDDASFRTTLYLLFRVLGLFGMDTPFRKTRKSQGEDVSGSHTSVATQESTPRVTK